MRREHLDPRGDADPLLDVLRQHAGELVGATGVRLGRGLDPDGELVEVARAG